jgi:hypothetical protein
MDNDLTYNQRQLQKMRNVIEAYHQKKVSLNDVLGTLDFLLNALEQISTEVRDGFLSDIAIIEIYVVVEIEGMYALGGKEQRDIENTLNRILSNIEAIYE